MAFVDFTTTLGKQAGCDELNARADKTLGHKHDGTDRNGGQIDSVSIKNTPSGNLSALTAQGALNELQSDIDSVKTASGITNVPSGNITAINVQTAIDQLQTLSCHRNKIINGKFDIGQRGASFTAVGYGLDRWRIHSLGTGGAATISRQNFTFGDTTLPFNPRYFLQWQQTTQASSAPELQQRIEYADTFSGRVATLQGWFKADAARTLQVGLRQSFGTGGSPSADVDTALQTLSLTTTWKYFTLTFTLPSVSGKTLGTGNNDFLALRILGPTGVTFAISMDEIQLEEGSVATNFEILLPDKILASCQRFYEKSFALDTVPAHGISANCMYFPATSGGFSTNAYLNISYKVQKRVTPTIHLFDPGAAGTGDQVRVYISGGAGFQAPVSVSVSSDFSFSAYATSASITLPYCFVSLHYIADSEL